MNHGLEFAVNLTEVATRLLLQMGQVAIAQSDEHCMLDGEVNTPGA